MLGLQNKKKATQQWSLRVTKDFVLNQVHVYRERKHANNVKGKFWLMSSFAS